MNIDPIDHAPKQDQVSSALSEVTEMRPITIALAKGPRHAAIQRWMDKTLIAAAAVLVTSAVIGTIIFAGHTMPQYRDVVLLVLSLVGVMALIPVAVTVTCEGAVLLASFWRPAPHHVAEYQGDKIYADQLAVYGSEVLAEVDAWLEQKIKRHERRQIRFFGGVDKLAVIVVIGSLWLAWKEANTALQALPSPVVHLTGSLLVGLVLGGLAVNRAIERLGFQRDLVRMALRKK